MHWAQSNRRISAWVAALALLLTSLAPTLWHAFQGRHTDALIEVCSTAGAKWVDAADELGARAPAPPSAPTHVFEHCLYCSLHATPLGMPPAAVVVIPPPLPLEVPRVVLAVPRTPQGWSAARPRAPPRFA